ncbi:phospholipid-transporting ATPase ABCA3-like isoform X1 [Dermacentor albipictus]|uniref:phospholipid-transporting ATPase ABCA3-like isoform X1 n=1 Tax=Dermacentor albipictus TaxID=60249 RepID=UPI0038FBEA5C
MDHDQDTDAGGDSTRVRFIPSFLFFKQLYVLLWKNVYIKRLLRHYTTTLLEIAFIVALLSGIQEDSVVREPLERRPDTYYKPMHSDAYWNTQEDLAHITKAYYYPSRNRYLSRLAREAFHKLGVTEVIGVQTLRQLQLVHPPDKESKETPRPAHAVALRFNGVGQNDTDAEPVNLHVSFMAGNLPFDLQVNYRQRLISQPDGPVEEERFPEMHTLLPIMGALQQRHLELQAERMHEPAPEELRLRRFPYPAYIVHRDQKNYALVLTRFCIGMLIPFTVLAARLTDEKATGMRELLRVMGLSDWVYWASHYLTAFFMHSIIVSLMLLFTCVKRNEEGRAFIQFSDPTLLFVILNFFCSQCLMHAFALSMFFAHPHSAIAGAMLYWTFSNAMPFLLLEHAGGQGYYYIARQDKLLTAIFPGMSLHWSFRVLERFEKFVERGANWSNFYDPAATPDNVTLAEIVFVGFTFDCILATFIWYFDNVFCLGPGVHKPYHFPLKLGYWLPRMTFIRTLSTSRGGDEVLNFEAEPTYQAVAVELVNASKDYDGVVAVDDVCLRIYNSQITVLLGHNGAGKTTLLNMITGFVDCTSGSALIGGYDVRICTRDSRQSIGYCPQYNVLFDDLTVEEHLMFFAIIKGIPLNKVQLEVVTLLHDASLMEHRAVLVSKLTPGLQRRLCTAIAIVATPKLVILDEPTTNMDQDGCRDLWEQLLKLRRTTCVLMTTQQLYEADVLGDRIAVMANGRIRCCGGPTFLKQRFGTGYRMNITKMPRRCQVATITTLLRKYAPKARVQSDSDNEVVFIIGQMVATKIIIEMFRDLESRTGELGVESVGLSMTSLEDVLIRVGEEYHVHRSQRKKERDDDATSTVEAKPRLVKTMATVRSSPASLWARTRAVFVKRAIHAWREKRMPLFSWVLPQCLLTVMFLLEIWGLHGSTRDVAHGGDTLKYTFPDVIGIAHGFAQADSWERKFREEILETMFRPAIQYTVEHLPLTTDINTYLLDIASDKLFNYVFNLHFGYQMTKATGTVLWYNGQIQHTAPLVMTAFNTARLRNITKDFKAKLSFNVVAPPRQVQGHGVSSSKAESEQLRSQNTYREVLPKVLRSVFLPLVSSLMCSNFVLFPIAERALLVKHLHLLTGLSTFLYWVLNFVFDFLFYIVTALCVLPPLWLFQAGALSVTDISLIFSLNLLHGYAALPCIYLASFLFDNPGQGCSTLAIVTFILSSVGCLGEVFMEHYAEEVNSAAVSFVIGTARQAVRLLPSCSYSRAMTKVLQLAAESSVCQLGGAELESQCNIKVTETKLSLRQCCEHMYSVNRTSYLIHPFDKHPYSAYYEVVTLSFQGAAVFFVLLAFEFVRQPLERELTSLDNEAYLEAQAEPQYTAASPADRAAPKRKKRHGLIDSDVQEENNVVEGIVSGKLPVTPGTTWPVMVVRRLHRSYGYFESNVVLRGLCFTVRSGECFGLLGVNGAGKTTTFRILTGEIAPHAGNAYIGTVSIVEQPSGFQRHLGYCPQRDGLLDMLTGVETLSLFTRLKGVPLTPEYLETLLDVFRLEDIADQLVGTYSMGSRRKLSLCIAMVGTPHVLLLDEPYVGVAPMARRRVVNYISALQHTANMSVVLTSHSLADVEFLCNRMAILGAGRLQCLGSLPQLKAKFGKGYTITVKTLPDRKHDEIYQHQVIHAVSAAFPGSELVHTYEGVLEFRISWVRIPWSKMFVLMARIKKCFKLLDFYIADTSLEQIFLGVTRKQACEAAAAAAQQVQQAPAAVHHIMTSTLGI